MRKLRLLLNNFSKESTSKISWEVYFHFHLFGSEKQHTREVKTDTEILDLLVHSAHTYNNHCLVTAKSLELRHISCMHRDSSTWKPLFAVPHCADYQGLGIRSRSGTQTLQSEEQRHRHLDWQSKVLCPTIASELFFNLILNEFFEVILYIWDLYKG